MSSVRLKKDHGGHKAGATISVPFGVGQTMVAGGIGEYPTPAVPPPAPAVATPTAVDRHVAEIARLNTLHAANLRDVREEAAGQIKEATDAHATALAKATADLDAANKTITDLQAQLKVKPK